MRRLGRVAACVVVLGFGGPPVQAVLFDGVVEAQTETLDFGQINVHGFGDRQNSHAWSMQWFKGRLYVGTNRNFVCVQRATLQFYFPEWNWYTTRPDRDVECAPTPQDLNLQAEIWRYTPEAGTWERVFQSPNDVPIPNFPGKHVARDIGFRGMVVFAERDGTEALYVAGVTAREYTPGLPPPRILRSTDGVTFAPIPQEPGTVLGELSAVGFRAMAVYKGRLYVTATAGLLGVGPILEAEDPAGGNNHFRQVSAPDMNVFELEVFNGLLYVGAGEEVRGYSVWKTDATGSPPYHFIPVVTDGAFRGGLIKSVVSMHPFQGRLYVGSSGLWDAWMLLPPSELIRINPDDSWDLVVGNPRGTPQGEKFPISGLPDSFGNPFNAHFWRMQEHNGALYLATNDSSWTFRVLPWLDPFIRHEYGFDLYMSVNGRDWVQLTRDGFGAGSNFGARTLASSRSGLFVGTANHASGTEIWSGRSGDSFGVADAAPGGAVTAGLERPDRVEAERQGGATVVSWEPSVGAVLFRVFRAAHWSNREVGIPQLPTDAWIPGQFSSIGTTIGFYFRDATAVPGVRYAYHVRAEGQGGQLSEPSNVIVPALAPVVTFDRVQTAIGELARRGKVTAVGAEALLASLVAGGRAAAERGDWPSARWWLQVLHRRVVQNRGGVRDPLAAEDLEVMVGKLLRRVRLTQAGVLPAGALGTE